MQTSFWLTLLWLILILIVQYLCKNKQMKNATNYSLENDVLINFNVDHKFHE